MAWLETLDIDYLFFSYIKTKHTLKITQRAVGSGSTHRDAPQPPWKRMPGSSPAGVWESWSHSPSPWSRRQRTDVTSIDFASKSQSKALGLGVRGQGTAPSYAGMGEIKKHRELGTGYHPRQRKKHKQCIFMLFFPLKPPQLKASGWISPGSGV